MVSCLSGHRQTFTVRWASGLSGMSVFLLKRQQALIIDVRKFMIRAFPVFFMLVFTCLYSDLSLSKYSGSQAYNHSNNTKISVNIATGTFHFSYPLIKTAGVHGPFTVNLSYRFNATGNFNLPKGWRFDIDHIDEQMAVISGQQWLIDLLWHDEFFYASGLRYYNEHGNQFYDKVQEVPIPGDDSLYYRYKLRHKDGSVKYFSYQGLLLLAKDRFGNRITLEYEHPIHKVEDTKLHAITDNYGNRYTFNYEPSSLVINHPDGQVQRIFFSDKGVKVIENQLKQRYEFEYTEFKGFSLLRTAISPEGLVTELNYDTIPYKNGATKGYVPVVNHFKQSDLATKKIHNNTHYQHSKGNNFTGYPLYSFTSSGDSLMDSNDQDYRYSVQVEQIGGDSVTPKIHKKIFEYNYLHLPVEIRTLKNSKNFLKTNYTYSISPFKYSRSTNYDKPKRVVHSAWNSHQGKYLPSNRVDLTYDLFGNKTEQHHAIYNLIEKKWRPTRSFTHKYFTESFSLLAETTDKDMITGRGLKIKYILSNSKKNHRKKLIYGMKNEKISLWQPWKKVEYCYDKLGRKTFAQLSWLAKGMPGIQKTFKKTSYHFDEASRMLTTFHQNSEGNVIQDLKDTRNEQLIKKIYPLGEKKSFRYNAIGQMTHFTDPEGNDYKIEHYTFGQDGLNATVIESPLGSRKREQRDASDRIIKYEESQRIRPHTTSENQQPHKAQDEEYVVVEEKEYNAFGKLAYHKNRFGFFSTYQYDDQIRLTTSNDAWMNETRYVYNDEDMSQQVFINGKKFKNIKKIPWSLKNQTTTYPIGDSVSSDCKVIEEQTSINGYGQVFHNESALLDMHSSTRHKIIKNYYEYDTSQNIIKKETRGFDGILLTKENKYDLFDNIYTFTKHQNDNGRVNNHFGYEYIYNTENKLVRVVTPKSNNLVAIHRYDKSGREIEQELADGHIIKYQYNPRGLVKSSSWNRAGKQYSSHRKYDADSRVIEVSDSEGQKKSYQYDLKGNLVAVIYPDKQQQHYEYDQQDRLVRQKNAGGRILTYHFDDQDKGKLSSIKSGNHQVRFIYGKDENGVNGRLKTIERDMSGTGKTRETIAYGPFGRMTGARTTMKGSANQSIPVFSKHYLYSARGELIKQKSQTWLKNNQQVINTSTYDYDGLKRLTKETQQQETVNSASKTDKKSLVISYQYDGNNNILKEQRKHAKNPEQTIHRYYNDHDQLVRMIKGGADLAITHDSNGRIITDHQGYKYQYDDVGLLLSVRDYNDNLLVEFHYLPDGLLSDIKNKQALKKFYYDKNLRVQTVLEDEKWSDFIQYGNKLLGTLTGVGGEHLFVTNQSTGAKLSVNKKGEKSTVAYFYEGYGQSKTVGDTANKPSTDFLWNQEFTDKTTGLTYLRNRFYHPELRRFITRDTQKVDNRYAYALANPISNIDPLGESTVDQAIYYTFSVIEIIGGIIGAYGVFVTGGLSLVPTVVSVAGWSSTAASGLALLGCQIAISKGHQMVGQDLRYVSLVLGSLGIIMGVAPLGPRIIAKFISPVTPEASEAAESIASISEEGDSLVTPMANADQVDNYFVESVDGGGPKDTISDTSAGSFVLIDDDDFHRPAIEAVIESNLQTPVEQLVVENEHWSIAELFKRNFIVRKIPISNLEKGIFRGSHISTSLSKPASKLMEGASEEVKGITNYVKPPYRIHQVIRANGLLPNELTRARANSLPF